MCLAQINKYMYSFYKWKHVLFVYTINNIFVLINQCVGMRNTGMIL